MRPDSCSIVFCGVATRLNLAEALSHTTSSQLSDTMSVDGHYCNSVYGIAALA
jgi:hypothetical protein